MTSKKRTLVTAALPYSNGRPHVGHIAGCYLPADTYVRYLRLKGREVRFVSGSDDYGVAIMLTAEKEGKTPAEVARFYNKKQAEAFAGLGIEFDIYSGTSICPFHIEESQNFFQSMYDQGFFEKVESLQFYDDTKKVFLPDRFVKGTCSYCNTPEQNGDQCENCGKELDTNTLKDARSVFSGQPASVKPTFDWCIDLSRFENDVKSWLETAAIRDQTRNYVKGLLSTGLVKRSMTRDIDWGIPLPIKDPDAQGKVMYVWFDAPIGYISNTKELLSKTGADPESYKEWWASDDCEVLHFIGEDNTIFHCVIWIAMLKAEGSLKLPKGVIVNQYLNIQFPGKDVEKISKSRGNAPWIEDYLNEGGDPDSLRYYLTSVAPERARTAYQPEDRVQRHNSELANVVGNFINRILSFTHKNFGPTVPSFPAEKVTDADRAFLAKLTETVHAADKHLEQYEFKSGLEAIMEFARSCNRYVDEKAPWVTRKTDLEATSVTLAYAIHGIRTLGTLFLPYMPTTGARILTMLGLDSKVVQWEDALLPLPQGHSLGTVEILFAKIDTVVE